MLVTSLRGRARRADAGHELEGKSSPRWAHRAEESREMRGKAEGKKRADGKELTTPEQMGTELTAGH
jgi:hypothetical protein